MDDSYGSGFSAGREGGGPIGDGSYQYHLGYVEGQKARDRGPEGGGVGVLFLAGALCWLYPMVGASVGVVGLVFYLGADTFPRSVLLLLLALAIVAWFFGFKLERYVSRFKPYRILRGVIRCVVGLYPFVNSLFSTGPYALSGGNSVLYLVLFAGACLLMKRVDRVMGFQG